ncbi:MAG TPA: hypothetical protein VFK05_18550 [Polyangiaceae bacterium]|nr:hypothetical protein [Polyangiaceae bacterium]
MPRARIILGSCLIAIGLALACGQGALNEAKPAPQAEAETRAAPQKQRELPRLIAPPPAYGNKIVLAQASPNR